MSFNNEPIDMCGADVIVYRVRINRELVPFSTIGPVIQIVRLSLGIWWVTRIENDKYAFLIALLWLIA